MTSPNSFLNFDNRSPVGATNLSLFTNIAPHIQDHKNTKRIQRIFSLNYQNQTICGI